MHGGDLYDALPGRLHGRVDVLVVNAPYVPTGALALLPPEARLHEPRTALDGGSDGLEVHRRVAASAPAWLAPGGSLLVEVGEDQAPALVEVVTRAGLSAGADVSPDDGTAVVTGARAHPTAGRVPDLGPLVPV